MGIKLVRGQNDLASVSPILSASWSYQRNAPLTPSDVVGLGHSKYWWICDKGHEWEASVSKRLRGSSCPYCSSNSVLVGYNDLATTNPELAKLWHPFKNLPLTPQNVQANTNKKIVWICQNGHESIATGASRNSNRGCPVCSNRLVLAGYNDLATTHPEIASQWHPTLNLPLTSDSVIASTNKKLWWVCPNGHEYQQMGNSRVAGQGCPKCSHRQLIQGETDLKSVNPELAGEWDFEKNAGLLPANVFAVSAKKVWWKCDQGHSWKAAIANRTKGNTGCPYCANLKVLRGYNDLGTVHPELLETWSYEQNLPLAPTDVIGESTKKYWWKCLHGHTWQQSPARRAKGYSCPYCSNKALLRGFNDLATTDPDLLASWHPTLNLPIEPSEVFGGSASKFWWVCPQGHEWQSQANNRQKGSGCPACTSYGFDSTRAATLYFIGLTSSPARKIGITNGDNHTDRLANFAKRGWFKIRIYRNISGLLIQDFEREMFRWIRKDLNLPVYLSPEDMGRGGGWSETFNGEEISDERVIAKLEEIYSILTAAKTSGKSAEISKLFQEGK